MVHLKSIKPRVPRKVLLVFLSAATNQEIVVYLIIYSSAKLTVWIRKLLAHFRREKLVEQLGQSVGLPFLFQKPVVARAVPLADTCSSSVGKSGGCCGGNSMARSKGKLSFSLQT